VASNPIVLAVLILGVGAGAFIDLRTRRVPNALTMTLASIGIACAAGGISGLSVAAAVLGLAHIGLAFFYTALAGGALALLVARRRRRLALTLEGTGRLIATGAAHAAVIEHPAANNRFAYAPAIAVGSVLAAFGL
jgi:prepilin signal peptidase PulO-like enzyme (type II secretory pathway)